LAYTLLHHEPLNLYHFLGFGDFACAD
jgi:hypothetical protein